MPFKSKAQQRFMFSQHPGIAKKWADETPNIKRLPLRVKKKKIAESTGVGNALMFKWILEETKYFHDSKTKEYFKSKDPSVAGGVVSSLATNILPGPVVGPAIYGGVIASKRKRENELLRKYARKAGVKEITKEEYKANR